MEFSRKHTKYDSEQNPIKDRGFESGEEPFPEFQFESLRMKVKQNNGFN